MAGKTLVVVREKDSFEFFFEEEGKYSWRVRDHPEAPGWFLVEEKEDGWTVGEFYDSYENAGVNDLQGLLESLVNDPERTLEGLFGERFEIEKVVVQEE
jgi:hypothetical protein